MLKGPVTLANFNLPIYVVSCGKEIQFRFPRSKKKRMQKKWRKNKKNWAYKPTWGETVIPDTSFLKVTDPMLIPEANPLFPVAVMNEHLFQKLQQVVKQRETRSDFLSVPRTREEWDAYSKQFAPEILRPYQLNVHVHAALEGDNCWREKRADRKAIGRVDLDNAKPASSDRENRSDLL